MRYTPRQPLARQLLQVCLFGSAVLVGGCGSQIGERPFTPPAPTTVADLRPLSDAPSAPMPTSVLATTAPPSTTPTVDASPTALPSPTTPPTALPRTLTPTTSPLSLQERRQVFNEVWAIVDEHYLYPDFHGLDWNEIREEYEPRAEAAESDNEFYAEVAEMIALLDDQHSRFLPPAAAQTEDTITSGQETSVGIGVLTMPTREGGFIQIVFPDSPAARAGVRPRDRIIAVDGRPYRQDDGDIHGVAGSTVRLNIVRPGEEPRDVVLVRQEVQGRIEPYYRRYPGDIGYVAIPTLWVNDMDAQVSGALTELVAAGELRGLILDLRANGGGWGHVLSGILGHFVRGSVGRFFDQRTSRVLDVDVPAGPDLRSLPLVVLIDGDTQSYAEVLAAVLQESGATVVGSPSPGNTESIYAYLLRDGSRLWLAQEGFRLQNGRNLEGHGVQPDSVVDVDWRRYSEDDDPHILEALRLLGAGPKKIMSNRTATIKRVTGETDVALSLTLDGTGAAEISTGIGFLDHMLTLFAKHGLFDLQVQATGDLHIDEHHTAEDVCICLGRAFDEALGERRGLVRTAHSFVPMDEALGFVAVDLGGRPYSVFDAAFATPRIGQLGTDLISHLFESIAAHGRMNIHARVHYGHNDHHKAEALFKALGRALDAATRIDDRLHGAVPSTKGTL